LKRDRKTIMGGSIIANGGVDMFINPLPTTVTVGGLLLGSVFPAPGVTFTQLLNLILYPFIPPTFSSFLFTGVALLEAGDSINSAVQAITWTTTEPGNIAVNSIDIDDVTGAVNLETGLPNTGTVTHDFSGAGAITYNVAAVNQFSITGTDTDPAGPFGFTRTLDIYWNWRRYVGDQAAAGNLGGAAIQALAVENAVNYGCAGTYIFPAAATYKTFAFPVTWVQPVSFTDVATGFNVPMQASYAVDNAAMDNAFGQRPAGGYNVYRTTNIIGGAITIQVV